MRSWSKIGPTASPGARCRAPTYRTVEDGVQGTDRLFQSEAIVKGQVVGCGTGRSKKDAEQAAAADALANLDRAGRRRRKGPAKQTSG